MLKKIVKSCLAMSLKSSSLMDVPSRVRLPTFMLSSDNLRSATSRARAFSKSSSIVPSDIGDSIYSQGVPAPTARSSSGNSNSEKEIQI